MDVRQLLATPFFAARLDRMTSTSTSLSDPGAGDVGGVGVPVFAADAAPAASRVTPSVAAAGVAVAVGVAAWASEPAILCQYRQIHSCLPP